MVQAINDASQFASNQFFCIHYELLLDFSTILSHFKERRKTFLKSPIFWYNIVIKIVINIHIRGFYEKKRSSSVNKKMITEEKLSTQKEIQDRLEAHNVFVTQTTLSRDLHEIGLTKVKKNDMVYYVLANETEKIDLVEFCLII